MVSLRPPTGGLGEPAHDFSLPGTDGKTWTLNQIRGERGTLVMFICNHCPYVRAVAERIVRDVRDLRPLGVSAVAVSSNDVVAYPEDSLERMSYWAGAWGFDFPYLYDESQQVARAYGAVCTPDFFGYNADLKLQYRGRLDASGKQPAAGAERELFAWSCRR